MTALSDALKKKALEQKSKKEAEDKLKAKPVPKVAPKAKPVDKKVEVKPAPKVDPKAKPVDNKKVEVKPAPKVDPKAKQVDTKKLEAKTAPKTVPQNKAETKDKATPPICNAKTSENLADQLTEHKIPKITQSSTKLDIKAYEDRLSTITLQDYNNGKQLPSIDNTVKFCIVIPSYNNEKYVKQNLNSVFTQKYHNWRIVYIDDASSDGTLKLVQSIKGKVDFLESKFEIISHSKRMQSPAYAFYEAANHFCQNEEIMVHLDGDDLLASPDVLNRLVSEYKTKNVWLTFGSFISTQATKNIDANKHDLAKYFDNIRTSPWLSSHLRTSYTWLFKKIQTKDLKYNEVFFPLAGDLAMMFPMLEMAGKNRSAFISDTLYIYRLHPNNEHALHGSEQLEIDRYIRKLPSYHLLPDQVETRKFLPNQKLTLYDRTYLNDLSLNYNKNPNNIPFYINVIWLTKNHEPLEMDLGARNNLKQNMELLNAKNSTQWKLFLWIHSQESTPETIKFCNTLPGCQVKEISELTNYKQTQSVVKTLINTNLFFLAENIIQASILKHIGGICIRPDFIFKNSPAILHNYFDFYAGFENKQIGTGFIAARPQHQVVAYHYKMIQTFYGIEDAQNLPYYIKDSVSCRDAYALAGGFVTLTASYGLYNNLYGNKDIIFKAEMLSKPAQASQNLLLDNKQIIVAKIGTQNYQDTYLNEYNNTFVTLKDSSILSPQNNSVCSQWQHEYGIGFAIDKVIKSANGLTCQENDPIEFISHRMWLTNPNNPKLLKKEILKIAQESINMLDNSGQEWIHYWWTLKDDHYTDEMKTMFNKNNIVLKTADELYPFYPGLEEAINNAGKNTYALSADMLRWVVIYHYGGLYIDTDYKITSTKVLHDLHHCSKIYLSNYKKEYVLNGLLASKQGGIIAEAAAKEYIRLMTDEPNKFQYCKNIRQLELMNNYGHIKPFINLILSERVDTSSVILVPINLMVDVSDKCMKTEYGKIHLSTLGFDYRFNTWNSDIPGEANTKKMDLYIANHDTNESTLVGDMCE